MSADTLLMPLQFGFMQEAFLIAAIVSVPTALLSCFLVVKGWALMGDAVSHAVLPGIVLAYIVGMPLIVGAFLAGMTCSLVSGYLTANSRVKPDTAMGVVFSGMFGIGIVLFVAIETELHLDHILFGNLLGVEPDDLWTAGIISLLVSVALVLKWKDLILFSFDQAQARASGLPIRWLHYAFLAALSLTIVATLSATGLILAIGLLIAPGAIAFLLARRFRTMLWLSVLVCTGSMIAGTYASFFLDSAPAPTIVLVLTLGFVLAFGHRLVRTRRASRRSALPVNGPTAPIARRGAAGLIRVETNRL